MLIQIDKDRKTWLSERGVECFLSPEARIPSASVFEPPCSLKWMQIEQSFRLGAFSYAVSGYYCAVTIGRYVSIGESVQIGRQNHPTSWLGTTPFQYMGSEIFSIGDQFTGSESYHRYKPHTLAAQPTKVIPTSIGNDVWIGHGAYLRAGVVVGDGAIIAAGSVVTKNVPPYAVVAGNPAQVKKFRVEPSLIGELLESQWWQFAIWDLAGISFDNPRIALHQIRERKNSILPYSPDPVEIGETAA